MGSGPHSPLNWREAARDGFASTQWTDNVARMHLFMREHPEVKIRTPVDSGTGQFTAQWADGEAADNSLGWLMDQLERHFA